MNSTLYPRWLYNSMTNSSMTYFTWCQTARNSRLQDTVYNNSTHLYWINGLKWTDRFSMLCIVDVSLCFLSVSPPKTLEITCVQHRASVFSLYSVFLLSIYSTPDNLVFCCLLFFFLFFLLFSLLGRNSQVNLFKMCQKKRWFHKVQCPTVFTLLFQSASYLPCHDEVIFFLFFFWEASSVSPLLSHYDLRYKFFYSLISLYRWWKVVLTVERRVQLVQDCGMVSSVVRLGTRSDFFICSD